MAICTDSADCDCECINIALSTLEQRDEELYAGVNAAEALIAALDAAYQAADAALQAQITTNASDITALDVRVTQNEADILALQGLYYPPENILNYGAVIGAGTEDLANQLSQGNTNSTAINNALSTHHRAYIPEGLFWVSSDFQVETGDLVYGDNRDETVLRLNGNNATVAALAGTSSFAMFSSAEGAFPYPNYTHHDGIGFRGFTIDLNASNQTNENGALNGIRVYGSDTRITNMWIMNGRAGASKEAFWINVSGTHNGVDALPARNCLIDDIVISDAGPQGNPGTAECSLILVSGWINGASTAEDLAVNCTVRNVVFRDLAENGTTQNREIWGIAVLGADCTIENCHMTDNITGNVSLIHYNSGSVDGQVVRDCHYDGEAQGVGAFRGLVGSYDPTFNDITFIGCKFKSGSIAASFVNWSDGNGSLARIHFRACTLIGKGSPGSRGAPLVLEQRKESALGEFTCINCSLEGDSGAAPLETGFYVFITSAEYGAVGAVPAGVADRLIVGDNTNGFGSRATNRAYLDSDGSPITYTDNSDFAETTTL